MTLRATILLSFLLLAPAAHAATVVFDPQDREVGTNAPFLIGVNLNSAEQVNAVALSLVFSPGLDPVEVSDGNSVVPLWVEPPAYDPATHTLSFSGVLPGGYSGEGGRLLLLSVRASVPGAASVALASTSRVYLNSADATDERVDSAPLRLAVSATRQNLDNPLVDVNPPEPFDPAVALLPAAQGERYQLIFATQDKGSGVSRFEVRESPALLPWLGAWHTAQSPYVLRDQSLSSIIAVRAWDEVGNVREVSIAPPRPVYSAAMDVFFIVILAGAAALGRLWFIWRK